MRSCTVFCILVLGCGSAERYETSPEAPPKPQYELPPDPPDPAYVWVPGRWSRKGDSWVWLWGAWERPKPGFARWVRGEWKKEGDVWVWYSGRWE